MAYAKGNAITAADFNTMISDFDAYWGSGSGNKGYGQTSHSSVSTGIEIGSAEWLALRNDLLDTLDHQGTTTVDVPPSAVLGTGYSVIAHDGVTDVDDLPTAIALGNTNSLTASAGNMTLSGVLGTNARASTWGAAATGITGEVSFTFTNADAAGYFFNSGGELRITPTHPNTSFPQDIDWNSILGSKVGVVKLGHTATSNTGTSSLGTAIGFYDLTAGYQTIYNGLNMGAGAYAANDCIISAKVSGTASGTRPGNVITIQVALQDDHVSTGGAPDVVQSGTQFTSQSYKATVKLTGIETPSWVEVSSF